MSPLRRESHRRSSREQPLRQPCGLIHAAIVWLIVSYAMPAISADPADLLGLQLEALRDSLARGVARRIPLVTASPGREYVLYNPALRGDDPEWEPRAFAGSQLYVASAQTLRKGALSVAVAWQHIAFDRFEGHDLDDLSDRKPVVGSAGQRLYSLPHTSIDIDVDSVSTSLTYGVSDALDVGIVVPILYSRFQRADQVKLYPDSGPFVVTLKGDVSSTGFGDILLRPKLALPMPSLLEDRGMHHALELHVRLPSGSVSDFRGEGVVVVSPGWILSTWDPLESTCRHASLSIL